MGPRLVQLPLPLGAFTEAVQGHVLHNRDPASIWKREIELLEASRMPSTLA
ncbi:msl8739 [Mesorhizobium japonicum MAFF 303099]|uniref:Msl8739 protein n=1 Tax=Mesorhizobium japonicum (strain LMG 29417 / CECT 9101 / MAFF 303099) TaxID=266835 RepID=Q98AW8_RHILO|nr:msl8739 [Mesorhizobium japonicum MAFF 303099]